MQEKCGKFGVAGPLWPLGTFPLDNEKKTEINKLTPVKDGSDGYRQGLTCITTQWWEDATRKDALIKAGAIHPADRTPRNVSKQTKQTQVKPTTQTQAKLAKPTQVKNVSKQTKQTQVTQVKPATQTQAKLTKPTQVKNATTTNTQVKSPKKQTQNSL